MDSLEEFDIDNGVLIYYNGYSKDGYVIIPNSVTSIGNIAFYRCENLKSIIIPNSVTSISEWMFEDCENLKSIIISDSVTSIGKFAFWECNNLESIEIPESVTNIGRFAFGDKEKSIRICEENGRYDLVLQAMEWSDDMGNI